MPPYRGDALVDQTMDALGASYVCRVENTRCPVIAMLEANALPFPRHVSHQP